MRNIKSDVYNTIRLIEMPTYEGSDNIFKPYFNTNEDLDTVLSITKVENKDVFCVQASSDHLFKCIEMNARTVDTFDINYLSKYFFYLKKVYLLVYGKMMDVNISKEDLYFTVDNFDINDDEEFEAHLFWHMLLPLITMDDFFKLFYIHPKDCKFDIDLLKGKLKNFKLNFNIVNMFENAYYPDKQYDVVIVSNIMESFGMNAKTHDLLRRIVKTNGEVVCSNVSTFDVGEHSMYERAKMDEFFYYDKGVKIFEEDTKMPYQVSYKYIKR